MENYCGPSAGLILMTLVAILTSTGCYIADWNESHIYNPDWPGHARFHNGQTMSMGLLLGICTLYYLYRSPSPNSAATHGKKETDATVKERRKMDLDTAVLLASLYWITQVSGYLYPGATGVDPPQDPKYWSVQLMLFPVVMTVVGVGYWLEKRRLGL